VMGGVGITIECIQHADRVFLTFAAHDPRALDLPLRKYIIKRAPSLRIAPPEVRVQYRQLVVTLDHHHQATALLLHPPMPPPSAR
jgi:hypothetical protein